MALTFLLAGAGLPWMVFVAQGGVTALGAFFGPASQAGVANLVDEEDLPVATAMMSATWGAMLAVGAAVGAGFTVLFGRDAAFVADAGSFVVAGLLLISIRTPMQADRDTAVATTPHASAQGHDRGLALRPTAPDDHGPARLARRLRHRRRHRRHARGAGRAALPRR